MQTAEQQTLAASISQWDAMQDREARYQRKQAMKAMHALLRNIRLCKIWMQES